MIVDFREMSSSGEDLDMMGEGAANLDDEVAQYFENEWGDEGTDVAGRQTRKVQVDRQGVRRNYWNWDGRGSLRLSLMSTGGS